MYQYNPKIVYNPRTKYNADKVTNLTNQQMPLSDHKSFTVDFPNIFIKYNITITPQDVNSRYGDIDKSLIYKF